AEPGEHGEDIVGDVDLPPVEALALRGEAAMMVVVPALAERDDRQQKVVPAGIGRVEPSAADRMRQRIDGERAVIEHRGADEEAPDEELRAGRFQRWHIYPQKRPRDEEQYAQAGGGPYVIAVQPAYL